MTGVLIKALRGNLLQAPQPTGDGVPESTSTTAAFPTSTLAAIQAQSGSPSAPLNGDHQARNYRVRRFAARLLGACHDGAVLDALLQAAQDADPELQREALIALGHHADPSTMVVVMQGLGAESRDVRLAALDALGQMDVKAAVAPLIERAEGESDAAVVQRIIALLGAAGDPQATGFIAQRLQDDDRQVRHAGLTALAELGDPGVIGMVRDAIFEHDGDLRLAAVSTLQRLGDTMLPRVLLTLLDDADREAHHWIALEALAEFYNAST